MVVVLVTVMGLEEASVGSSGGIKGDGDDGSADLNELVVIITIYFFVWFVHSVHGSFCLMKISCKEEKGEGSWKEGNRRRQNYLC